MRMLKPLLPLGCPLLSLAAYTDWGGAWMLIPATALGVGSVLATLSDRQERQLDAPITLRLNQ